MIILAILALAVLANGNLLDNEPRLPMDINTLRTMCEQNGADFAGVELAAVNFVQCMEVDFGVKMLETEIEDAHSYDAYNKVFKKYGRKTPELKACFHNLFDVVAPCLEREKQDLKTVFYNINDQIIDYLCESDGYIISKFIMEGGPQCFTDKGTEIMMCGESFINLVLSKERNTFSKVEGKHVFDDIAKCFLRSVETCPSHTPFEVGQRVAQIIRESYFRVSKNNASNVVSQRGVLLLQCMAAIHLPATLLAIIARLCNIRQYF